MASETSAAMPHWKSQLEVNREGSRYEKLRVYFILQLCRLVLWASEAFFDGHTEKTQLGISQAVNKMDPRGLVSHECALAIGKLSLLAELKTTVRLRTIAGTR